MSLNKSKSTVKPKLRCYTKYITDMKEYAKKNADKLFHNSDQVDINALWKLAKASDVNLHGLRSVKKDRREICNRIMELDIYDAKMSYSKSISTEKYNT